MIAWLEVMGGDIEMQSEVGDAQLVTFAKSRERSRAAIRSVVRRSITTLRLVLPSRQVQLRRHCTFSFPLSDPKIALARSICMMETVLDRHSPSGLPSGAMIT